MHRLQLFLYLQLVPFALFDISTVTLIFLGQSTVGFKHTPLSYIIFAHCHSTSPIRGIRVVVLCLHCEFVDKLQSQHPLMGFDMAINTGSMSGLNPMTTSGY